MQDQPRYEAYEANPNYRDKQGSRPLIEGTVARGQLRDDNPYLYTGRMDATGRAPGAGGAGAQTATGGAAQPSGGDVNARGANVAGGAQGAGGAQSQGGPDIFPFPITKADLDRGQERFNAFCAMCHGQAGDGDGMIWRRGFQKPPSFHDDAMQEGQKNAAHFFDVITNGFGAMPSYAEMMPAEDRWRIIAYVRALQLSRRANVADASAGRGNLSGPQAAPGGAAQPPAGGQPPHGGER